MKELDQARRFLTLAEQDIHAFNVLKVNTGISESVTCFHAQQAVEKCLKAALSKLSIPFKKTHDLYELSWLLTNSGHAPPVSAEKISLLNPYAVTFRYEDEEITTLSLSQASEIVDGIHQWTLDQMKQ